MKHGPRKYILPILLLIGTVGLMTGIDQYIHIHVCHHESHCQTKLPENHSTGQSDSDEHHCPVCQFFACGQNKFSFCEHAEAMIEIIPALRENIENTDTFSTEHLDSKISRGPPAV